MNLSSTSLGRYSDDVLLTDGSFPSFVGISGEDAVAVNRLGIDLRGNRECMIYVAGPDIKLSGVTIDNHGVANEYAFGNSQSTQTIEIRIRTIGSACRVIMPRLPPEILRISDIFLREDNQTVFWGSNSSAVSLSIEMAGQDTSLMVGDDCMFSSGIWLRNFDMHTIFDLATDETLNRPRPLIKIDRHVWFGADSSLLGANVGYGSIVAARALVTSDVPPISLVGGVPARILRTGIGWTRHIGEERDDIRKLMYRLQEVRLTQSP
jgi:hypothetical protein